MEIVFFIILALIAFIGLSSSRKNKPTLKNYYLADQSLHPLLAGLSAMATNNSGYMFIGLIGFTYVQGLSSIWLMLGWIIGDFLVTQIVFTKLIPQGLKSNKVTYASIIGNWSNNRWLTKFIATLSFLFLIIYASAQFAASGKTLMVIMQWEFYSGVLVGGIIVILYSFAGGIRASIWTDAAQSIVMLIAMAMLAWFGVNQLGGLSKVMTAWTEIDGYLSLFETNHTSQLYQWLSGLSWVVAGIFVIAQPHIMIRFFAVKNLQVLKQSRIYYYSGFIIFYGLAFMVGMLSRIYIGDIDGFDPELALPTMAQMLFNPFLLGMIVAGIFAATMSTADSLIINCSGNISHDLLGINAFSKKIIKTITLGVSLFAIGLALINSSSVFSMVDFSWTIIGYLFTPIILMLFFGKTIKMKHVLITSLLASLLFYWMNNFNYYEAIYAGVFPFLFSSIYLSIFLKKNSDSS